MTALAIAKNARAELHVEVDAPVLKEQATLAVTRIVPFEDVRHVIEAGRAPRRPNRNRPINAPPLSSLLQLAKENPPPPEFFEGDVECPW